MARSTANKLYRTFVKGLVTEASPLTYPEDTSQAELNTVLSRKGSRTRRQGINYAADSIVPGLNPAPGETQSEFIWKAVAKEANTNFFVVQRGLTLRFFTLGSNSYADTVKDFSVDLSEYLIPQWSASDAVEQIFQMSSGKGFMFVVGRPINPIVIEYLPDTDTIVVNPINILIRDFDGLNDGLANDEEPAELTKEHHYNLLNQGWLYGSSSSSTFSPVTYDGYTLEDQMEVYNRWNPLQKNIVYSRSTPENSPIAIFKNFTGRYPGNNKQWWVARAEADNPDENVKAGDFLPDVLNKLYSGNNRAPNGHFIVNAFNKDRSSLSGVSDIPAENLGYRPEAVAFFSGRAWYGAGSVVYFSQILDSTGIHKAGLCYQEADPTAEDISDLIPSDGGVVPIPEADRIRKLVPMGNGVLVLAQNGVWFVGGESSFSATGIGVSKVSSIGTKSPYAALEVDETLFWWNETGIQAMQQASGQFGPIPGKFGNSSISEQTIQSLFNEIPENNKVYAKATFDPRNNRVIWLYSDIEGTFSYYNKCLVFDLTLQAFFLWEFATYDGPGPRVTGIYDNIGRSFAIQQSDVVDASGEPVIALSNEQVISVRTVSTYAPTNIQFTVDVPEQGMAIASLNDTAYVDWASFDGEGLEYESFVETGFELMADAMREKQAIYVFCHFRQAGESSCKMTTKWDWARSASSNRWSPTVEVYRERNRPNNSTADLTAFEVVTSKNKVRGNGKSIQFRFGTSQRGKNFELLGWSVAFIGNTQP